MFYAAVSCGSKKKEILLCGTVRFSDVANPTVNRTEPHRTVKKYRTVQNHDVFQETTKRSACVPSTMQVLVQKPCGMILVRADDWRLNAKLNGVK